MTKEDYLDNYCMNTDCTEAPFDCEVCMYNKGREDTINEFVRMCEENTHCVYTTEQVDMSDILEIAEKLRGEIK